MGDIHLLTDIRAVDHEYDGVAAGVIALPQIPQRHLPADIPDLQVHIRQRHRGDILADSGDGLPRRGRTGRVGGGGRHEEGLDLVQQGGLSGVVETKKYDGIFCRFSESPSAAYYLFVQTVPLCCHYSHEESY